MTNLKKRNKKEGFKRLSPKQIKKQKEKEAKELKSTLDWIDIESISADGIVLARGKKKRYVKGFLIKPTNIHLLPEAETKHAVLMCANALDHMKYPVYWKFIKTRPDVGIQQQRYADMMKHADKPAIRNLMQSEIDKLEWFEETHREITFVALIQADEINFEKTWHSLAEELYRAFGRKPVPMRLMDYENLVSQEFENDNVNRYMTTQLVLPDVAEPEEGVEI